MCASISAEQRDALYELTLDQLSGIGGGESAPVTEEEIGVQVLGQECSDDLRLLLDDLGVGHGNGGPVQLISNPDALRRTLPRLQSLAELQAGRLDREFAESDRIRSRNLLVTQACDLVLRELRTVGQ
jgi:hypothetical protein